MDVSILLNQHYFFHLDPHGRKKELIRNSVGTEISSLKNHIFLSTTNYSLLFRLVQPI
jgi:hypothetical protein